MAEKKTLWQLFWQHFSDKPIDEKWLAQQRNKNSARNLKNFLENLVENKQDVQPTNQNDIFMPGSQIGVLLIHGLSGTPQEMKSLGKRLNDFGFSVYIPCLAGHCGSPEDLLVSTHQDWLDSVYLAFLKLQHQYKCKVIFSAGLCVGATIALNLCERLIVEKSGKENILRGQALFSLMLQWDGWSIPKLAFLLPLIMKLPYFRNRYLFYERPPYGIKNERLRHKISLQMLSGDSKSAGLDYLTGITLKEQWNLIDLTLKKYHLNYVETPTLLIHSKFDDICHHRNSEKIFQQISSKIKKLILLENSYHMIVVDNERSEVANATLSFFVDLLNQYELEELTKYKKVSKDFPRENDIIFQKLSPEEFQNQPQRNNWL